MGPWRKRFVGVLTSLCVSAASGGVVESRAWAETSASPSIPPVPNAGEPLRASTLLRAADLQADADLLRLAYESLHPGLHRYNTPEELEQAFRALRAEFQQDRSLGDAYLAFSIFAAKVRCGHTYASFFNQKKAVSEALFRAPRIPFYFRWLGDRMVVTQSFAADPRLRAGSEVLSLNDVSVRTVLERLLTVARADGHNDAKRVAYLGVDGSSPYEAFDIYVPLLFPGLIPLDPTSIGALEVSPSTAAPPLSAASGSAPGSEAGAATKSSLSSGPGAVTELRLKVRAPTGGPPFTLSVPLESFEARKARVESADVAKGDKNAPAWTVRFEDKHLAVLRMPTWALYNSTWNWQAFLNTTFEALAQSSATDLMIDLRGNEGGLDVGDELVRHLISQEVPRQAVVRRVRYRSVPQELRPFLDTWDPSFLDWGEAALGPSDGFFTLIRDSDDALGSVLKPLAPRFAGRVWVIVGPTNSSATFEFAQTVRQNRLATLVGQPTGGNQRGINGGAFFFLRLPRSGIELDLPLIGQFPAGDRPDGGLEPDIRVTPTLQEIADGRDAELAAVKAQLKHLGQKRARQKP